METIEGMKITILCPECYSPLTKHNGAKNISVIAGGNVGLHLECVSCSKTMEVKTLIV